MPFTEKHIALSPTVLKEMAVEVAREIISLFPDGNMVISLRAVLTSILYAAPEAVPLHYNKFLRITKSFLPEKTADLNEWQITVLYKISTAFKMEGNPT